MSNEIETLRAEVARLQAKLSRPQPLGMVLLDENEALRGRVAEITKERDTAWAEKRAILTGIGADGADDETAALIVQLRARVAELEVSLGSRIVSEGELALLLETSERREAQHLADIKAMMDYLQLACWSTFSEWQLFRGEARALLQRLTHYNTADKMCDDAKTDTSTVIVHCGDGHVTATEMREALPDTEGDNRQ